MKSNNEVVFHHGNVDLTITFHHYGAIVCFFLTLDPFYLFVVDIFCGSLSFNFFLQKRNQNTFFFVNTDEAIERLRYCEMFCNSLKIWSKKFWQSVFFYTFTPYENRPNESNFNHSSDFVRSYDLCSTESTGPNSTATTRSSCGWRFGFFGTFVYGICRIQVNPI